MIENRHTVFFCSRQDAKSAKDAKDAKGEMRIEDEISRQDC